ncbi:MAG: thermonuclease family protein [Cypionkella sp.]|nr:thermonuclease family protein [Cypionkella sp.]
MIMTCILIAITDGDTIRTDCGRIRIANIDAPETRVCPVEADAATRHLATLINGTLTVNALYTDRYGRIVGVITDNGRDVGAAMVTSGHAQPWPHSPSGRALTARPRGVDHVSRKILA